MSSASLRPTVCAICRTPGHSRELYPARLPAGSFEPRVFSARRSPDGVHYRLVRCDACGLVRSDPVADESVLEAAYSDSGFDYADEVVNLVATYGDLIAGLDRFGLRRGSYLEIGCGSGFMLEEALRQGFADARGVEPSEDAVRRASPAIRERIVRGMFRPGLFPAESFDLICLFQVLDHLPDPGAVLRECRSLLRAGGLVLTVNHNLRALSARLLGERSPIIDVEHTYQFDPRTASRLFEEQGLRVLTAAPVSNRVSLGHLLHLLPVPDAAKTWIRRIAPERGLRARVRLPLGNLCVVAGAAPGQPGGAGD